MTIEQLRDFAEQKADSCSYRSSNTSFAVTVLKELARLIATTTMAGHIPICCLRFIPDIYPSSSKEQSTANKKGLQSAVSR